MVIKQTCIMIWERALEREPQPPAEGQEAERGAGNEYTLWHFIISAVHPPMGPHGAPHM